MPEKSPGQVAYTVWERTLHAQGRLTTVGQWALIGLNDQAAWDAAAQAVRQQAIAETLEAQRLLADAVRQMPTATSQGIVDAINARERASLEELRRQVEDTP